MINVSALPEDTIAALDRIVPNLGSFMATHGVTLHVTGAPGVGKTTLALEIADAWVDPRFVHFLSVRIPDPKLRLQFPWLPEAMSRQESALEEAKGRRSALHQLEGTLEGTLEGDDIGDDVDPGASDQIAFDLQVFFPELEVIYEQVEEALPNPPLVIIDSLDALAERYGIDALRLFTVLRDDLASRSGVRVVVIREDFAGRMGEYLSDGNLELVAEDWRGRRLRLMHIHKLRGCAIRLPTIPFSLDHARFRRLDGEYQAPQGSVGSTLPAKLTTGLPILDELIGGGWEAGSVHLFVIGPHLPHDLIRSFERQVIVAQISAGRGALWIPARESTAPELADLSGDLGDPADLERLFILQPDLIGTHPRIIPLEGKDPIVDLGIEELEIALEGAERPFLVVLNLDVIDSIYGRGAAFGINQVLSKIRRRGHIGLLLGSSTPVVEGGYETLCRSTTYLEMRHGVPFLLPEKPFDIAHAIVGEPGVPFSGLRRVL